MLRTLAGEDMGECRCLAWGDAVHAAGLRLSARPRSASSRSRQITAMGEGAATELTGIGEVGEGLVFRKNNHPFRRHRASYALKSKRAGPIAVDGGHLPRNFTGPLGECRTAGVFYPEISTA